MTGDLGPRHREAHVREQATLAALADVSLGVLVGLCGRGADDVDPELRREALEFLDCHASHCAYHRER